MHLTLGQTAEATGGEILAGDPAMSVGGEGPGGISIDSRSIADGQWFAALTGKTGRDGHDFLCDAINRGASGIIISDRDEYELKVAMSFPDIPTLLVPDTTIALADIARALLEKYKPFVIAITGTVGKTTVKEYVAHIASTRWPVLKNPHNWNTEIGLPLTVFNITPDHRVAVLECASRGKGQINYLSMIARPHVAVITAIGPGHLSEFGSVENVARAKWEIVDGLRDNGTVVALEEAFSPEISVEEFRILTFGLDATSSVHPIDITYDQNSTIATIVTPIGRFETKIRGTSRADLLNVLCATACAMQITVDSPNGDESLTLDEIAEAIRTLPSTPGRMEEIVRPSGVNVIFDAYNSNPISLRNALDALSQRKTMCDGSPVKRRVAILGDMLELGDDEEMYHREAGSHIAKLQIDCLITVGSLAEFIRAEADTKSGERIDGKHYESTEECADELSKWLRSGDLVLIKASRNLAFEILLDEEW